MPPNDQAAPVIDAAASEILKNDVSLPLEPALLTPAQRMLRDIEDMTIDADAMYDIAGSELKRIKGAYNKLEAERLDLTRPLDEVKKKIMARYAKPLETLAAAEGALKGKMLTYHAAREAKERAERDRLEALARAERERLAKEAAEIERKAQEAAAAERERVAAEQKKAREAAEAEAEKLAAAGREQEAIEARARAEREAAEREAAAKVAAAEAKERAEREAAALRDTAAVVVATPPATVAPKATGTSVRTTWRARVVDKAKVIAFVAATPQFETLLDVNDTNLNALARSLKQNLRVDGVEVYEERGLASRSS